MSGPFFEAHDISPEEIVASVNAMGPGLATGIQEAFPGLTSKDFEAMLIQVNEADPDATMITIGNEETGEAMFTMERGFLRAICVAMMWSLGAKELEDEKNDRVVEALTLKDKGYSNVEIANKLDISESTVRSLLESS
jgi:DNA-binding NarL/FixJ family response regulator